MSALPRRMNVVAVETSAVDYHYPVNDGGDQTLKYEFLSAIPKLSKMAGFGDAIETPRKGSMITIPAETLDNMLLTFKQLSGNFHLTVDESLPTEQQAERVRNIVLGRPNFSAGGSVANTFDAMIYSKVNGEALFNGTFVTSVGKDDAGQYFKDSFHGNIVCTEGGRQLVSHVIPIDGDRIMISSGARDGSDRYFDSRLLSKDLLQQADLIMIGGYTHYTEQLGAIVTEVARHSQKSEKTPIVVFTLASQQIAEINNVEKFPRMNNTVIHGNTGEFRRFMKMDTQWRQRFRGEFIDKNTGAPLNGREEEQAKNSNANYINAKQAANELALMEAVKLAKRAALESNLSFVVTNGARPARVATKDGVYAVPNSPITPDRISSTVGAGDNHTAGYWIGKALSKDEMGCLSLAAAFAHAVIQIPEARLSHHTFRKYGENTFEGPIANIHPTVLNAL